MNTKEEKPPQRSERPESKPHGTTADQIAEMESEGGQPGQVGQAGQAGPHPAAPKRPQ